MQGKFSSAVDIVAKGVKMNGRGIALDKEYYISRGNATFSKQTEPESGGISDLFKTPRLRMKTLNVCLCWFANSLVYYGLSLSAGKLKGNPFLMLFLMGLVEFPSYFVIVLVLDRLGRRSITSGLMLLGGLCCIVAAYIAQGSTGKLIDCEIKFRNRIKTRENCIDSRDYDCDAGKTVYCWIICGYL